MNRLEFLTSLRYSLEKGGLPQADIEDALSYYEEIFLDSGYGSDEQTAKSLGSPEELAREILLDNGIHADGDATFEVGDVNKKPYEDFQDVDFEEVGKEEGAQNGYGYGGQYGAGGYGGNNGQGGQNGAFTNAANKFGQAMDSAFNTAKDAYNRNFNDPSMTNEQKRQRNNNLLKILIVVISSPLWIGLAGGIFGGLVGLLAAIFAVIVALFAAGVSLIAAGIAYMFSVPPMGLMMLGAGMVVMGIFGLAARPCISGFVKLIKWAVDGCVKLCKKIFS